MSLQHPRDIIEDLFGGEDLQIEPIEVDDAQYRQYILPIYARLHLLNKQPRTADEGWSSSLGG